MVAVVVPRLKIGKTPAEIRPSAGVCFVIMLPFAVSVLYHNGKRRQGKNCNRLAGQRSKAEMGDGR